MLSLNKPFLNYSTESIDIDNFFNQYFKNRYYQVTFSARQGLWLTYERIKKEKGSQIVAVSPLTCIEAIYPILEHGHKIHFVDINPATLNMDECLIPEEIDVVQVIHFGGNPQEMSTVIEKSPKLIVEDCAQGFGSYYKDRHVGCFGNYSTFSFMKNLYSLGGGLLLFEEKDAINNYSFKNFGLVPTLYRYIKRLLESKCSFDSHIAYRILKFLLFLKPEHTTEIINNSSVNNIIYNSIERQLGILDIIVEERLAIARKILSGITNPNMVPQTITKTGRTNYLRLFFVLEKEGASKEAISKLRKRGIGANHLTQNQIHPYQERFDKNSILAPLVSENHHPNYFAIHDRVISVPISPNLTSREIDYICKCLNSL